MARRFSGSQRIQAFIEANGRCAECGEPLQPGWHADHIYPYSKGGQTEDGNIQALCPACNLKKGGRVLNRQLPPWKVELRRWQTNAFRTYINLAKRDFLAVATPGSGKTIFGLRVLHHLFKSQIIQHAVIVVHTEHLKTQWADKAHKVAGIQLDPGWQNRAAVIGEDFDGVCVTYQQVASNPRIHNYLCRNSRAAVIFDEIHHVGDNNEWGKAIKYAFDLAVKRLGISGTLFRTDNVPIPYVRYNDQRQSDPDFEYGYAEAIAEDVCRHVFFPSYEGTMDWYSRGETISASFKDQLPTEEQNRRLRTALDPDGDRLRELIRDADQKLDEVRSNGHPFAGGPIIAMDQNHAREIARLVSRITRRQPTLAISDEPSASDRISDFKNGKSRWLVAVKMVSEGVDIPRLRVGIYATNVQTELFFRQAVGRFVRVQPNLEEQNAYIFIPGDKTLIEYAQRIRKERIHQLREEVERILKGEGTLEQVSLYAPISSTARPDDVIYGDSRYSQEEIRRAEICKAKAGLPSHWETVYVARLLREARELDEREYYDDSEISRTAARPLYDEKIRRRKIIKRMVGHLHYRYGEEVEFKDIYNRLSQMDGVWAIEQCTLEQLETRIKYLHKWLDEGYSNDR